MGWKPLPADVPLDHEALAPPDVAAPTDAAPPVADAPAPAPAATDFAPLPADAPLDQPAPETATVAPDSQAAPGWTDAQKQQILDYMPKAKDAADLERFSNELSGGKQHIANADKVLAAFKAGNHTFGWLNGIQAQTTPAKQDDGIRGKISDALIEGVSMGNPVLTATLKTMRDDGTMQAYFDHVANGLTFDYGPEVAGALDTLAGGGLKQNIAHERARLSGDSSVHPIASGAGELTGVGLATPIVGAAAEATDAARLAGTAGPKARAFAQQALEGAAYGSGAGGPDNRGEGAAVGSAAAPVGAVAIEAPAALYQAGKSVLSESPTLARRIIAKAIDADQNTPGSVARDISAANSNDVPMAIADTGENARGLLAAASRSSGVARTIARDSLTERQAGLADRVTGAIERDLGPVANPHQVADTLMTKANNDAAPLYAAAYARPGAAEFAQKVSPLLDRPSMKPALANAYRLAQEEGRDPTTLGLATVADRTTNILDAAGNKITVPEVTISRTPSWQTLDYVKRGMDDVVEGYKDATTGRYKFDTNGRAVNGTLRSYLKAFDAANPDYAAARAAYGGPVSGISAMNTGRKFLNMTADDIEARMRDMTPFEKQMAALGARRAMAETVASKGDSADVVNALVGTGKKRAMLARLFGDRKQFGRFVDTLGQEREGFRTFKQALLGSPTAPNLQDDATLQLAVHAADAALTGLSPIAAIRSALKFGVGKIGDKAKQQVAALLSNTDPARFEELAAQLRSEAVRRGLFNRKVGVVARDVGNSAAIALPSQSSQP